MREGVEEILQGYWLDGKCLLSWNPFIPCQLVDTWRAAVLRICPPIMLLEHLPNSWKVGCLYDIGCQIHHAVHKWDFASEWREHLSWGVSIFHTYGHQWACQLWYHPRKDALWGLSDGEGCERFWSELCHLI